MYGKVIENEIHRIKRGNRSSREFMLTTEELSDLVERAKKGDNAAQCRIWETHLLFITKRLATSKYVGEGRCRLDPDEALGFTWESLLKAIQSYNGTSSFSFWWWRKCMIDLKSEWRRRFKENERHPLFSDIFPDIDDDEDVAWLGREYSTQFCAHGGNQEE